MANILNKERVKHDLCKSFYILPNAQACQNPACEKGSRILTRNLHNAAKGVYDTSNKKELFST